jgi:hypothetical protein
MPCSTLPVEVVSIERPPLGPVDSMAVGGRVARFPFAPATVRRRKARPLFPGAAGSLPSGTAFARPISDWGVLSVRRPSSAISCSNAKCRDGRH